MIEWIIIFLCSTPLVIILYNLKRVRERVFNLGLSIYDYVLKEEVKKQQKKMEESRFQSLYLGDDEEGAYVLIKKQKVYLNVMKARPLEGFLAGENYYTTNEAEKLIEMKPKRRF